MDKSLLVVVLCLQVFLLITAFTSTDAAALVTDDQQQQSPDLVEAMRLPKRKIRRVSSSACSLRPGACIGFRREPPTKPPIKKSKENAKMREPKLYKDTLASSVV